MFAYSALNTANWDEMVTFYDGFFRSQHVKPFFNEADFRGYGTEESQPYFGLAKIPTAPKANGGITLALRLPTPNRVRMAYEKALELGADSVEPPKSGPSGFHYSASFRDPDSNLIVLKSLPKIELPVPMQFRRGSLQHRDMASVRSGLQIIKQIERHAPVENAVMLDFGCGVKLSQALRHLGDPQKKYIGLDVFGEMIDFLKDALGDNPKYQYEKVPFHNAMYNTDGKPMTAKSTLPIGKVKADIIGLFSVITHMVPDDTLALLTLLKRYAHKETRLVMTAISDDEQTEDFVDEFPDRPLLRAIYRRDYLVGLIEKSGWEILVEEKKKRRVMNDSFVCKLA